jgi:hypothetical protein
VQSARRSCKCKDSTRWRLTSMALFEMKTFLLLEMRTRTGLLRPMTGKMRRPLVWHHRHRRAQSHLNTIMMSKSSGLMRNPTSQMKSRLSLLTAIKAALGDITFDRTIHY